MNKVIILFIAFFIFLPFYGKSVYVANNGNDNNNGSINSPFKTIKRALSEKGDQQDTLLIFLREGIYIQKSSLLFDEKKSIILKAYNNESVSILGGKVINSNKIQKPKDLRILRRFNKEVRNKIRFINFESLNIKPIGLSKRGFAYKTQPSWTEIFIDDIPLELSRWPNEKMILIDSVINPGNNPSKGIKGKGNPIITYKESELQKWESVKDAWICGYFGAGWADDMLPLDSINKFNKILFIGSSTNYGFQADGLYRRWYVRNIPEEVDIPGEYYFENESSKLYFLPPRKKMKDIKISILEDPIIMISSCQNIKIENIKIECSRGVGIQIDNSENIIIDSCILRNLGNLGVKITNTTSNSGIQNSYIYQTGAGGIELNGGNRKRLIAGNNYVKNCRINDFNRIERSYRPGIHLKGVGNKISNVEIFDAPSMAIYMHGNNHTIEYVDIHHVCKEVHDQGAIYYGRNPTERGHKLLHSYIHDIQSPYSVIAMYHDDGACGMDVYGCIFNNISSASVLIGGGQDIKYINNVFMNLSCAIQVDNRLKIWKSYAKWLNPGGEFEKKTQAVNYNNPPFSEEYPELLEYWKTDPAIPKRNVIQNNIFYNVTKLIHGDISFLEWKNNLEIKENPGLIDVKEPLKGFDGRLLRDIFSSFKIIAVEKIGCDLPQLR